MTRYADKAAFDKAEEIFLRMDEGLAFGLMDIIQREAETGAPDKKEIMYALEQYFGAKDQKFRDGFDEALVLLTGWSLPTLLEQAEEYEEPA